MGITLEEIDLNASLPINPTIIRIMRVLRITRGTRSSKSKQANRQGHTCAIRADAPPCFSAEAAEDGHGDESPAGHRDASPASGERRRSGPPTSAQLVAWFPDPAPRFAAAPPPTRAANVVAVATAADARSRGPVRPLIHNSIVTRTVSGAVILLVEVKCKTQS